MDYIFYYVQTLVFPLLALTVGLCILRYCCKYCRISLYDDPDLDLSDSDHVYVIPNPIHTREEREEPAETQSHEDSEFTPPPYDLVCPPPSYTEASFKLSISDVQATPDSEMEDVPPPPYCPPLNMMFQPSGF